MNKKENRYIKPFVLLAVTVVFSLLATLVDRQPIGYDGTSVGFASLNGPFRDFVGYNVEMDMVSDICMVIAIAVAGSFALWGLIRLIKEKSFSKVGKVIICLGAVYVLMAILYVVFDKVPVNYRPILVPGETKLETSFPSSHVLVICTIMGTAYHAWDKLIENKNLARILRIVAFVTMPVGTAARAVAGVHWISDIVAGILFSATLISLYAAWIED